MIIQNGGNEYRMQWTVIVNPFNAGTDLRHQILTSKIVPRTEKVKLLNETERAFVQRLPTFYKCYANVLCLLGRI